MSGRTEPRRMSEIHELCGVSTGDAEKDRFDVLIHALAQLPEDVTLRLCGVRDRAPLELLGQGYGISDRIRFANAPNGSSVTISYACGRNGPASECVEPVFDPAGDPLKDSDGLTLAELVHRIGSERRRAPTEHGSDDRLRNARVAVVTNLPAPYRTTVFSSVAH